MNSDVSKSPESLNMRLQCVLCKMAGPRKTGPGALKNVSKKIPVNRLRHGPNAVIASRNFWV